MNIQVFANKNINTDKLLNFFKLLHKEHEASTEEVFNFSRDCLEYVFKLQNIDISKYTINLHFVRLETESDGRSYMIQDEKDENKFEIYADITDLKFQPKPLSQMVYYDEAKSRNYNKDHFNDDKLKYTNALTKFSYFLNTILHEYAHVIQYIKAPNLITKSDMDKYLTAKNMQKYLTTITDKDKSRTVEKQFNTHYFEKDFTRLVEKDANRQATLYTITMLKHLINSTDDFKLKIFLYNLYKVSKQIKKEDYLAYRISNKKNKQAIKILNENDVPEDCFLCF